MERLKIPTVFPGLSLWRTERPHVRYCFTSNRVSAIFDAVMLGIEHDTEEGYEEGEID